MSETMDNRFPFALIAKVIEISNSNILIENRLKTICDLLCRESDADCVCIYRRDPRGADLSPWVSSCMQIEECSNMDFVIRPGESAAGKAAYKRAPVFFPDVKATPPAPAISQELRDFTSILCVPVMDDVYLYGVVNFSSLRPVRYTGADLEFFRTVATEVAGAIRNSRLYNDARKRVSELITLNEIGRTIVSTLDVEDILEYVSKTTTRLLSAHGCTIRLWKEGRGGGLRVMMDEGYGRDGFRREFRVAGKKLATQIFLQKRPLLINGPEDSPLHATLERHGITSFLGLPIVAKDRSLGVISYYSASPRIHFDMEVVHLMQTVSSQLANMIEHATMFEKTRQLAQENQDKMRRISALYDVARVLMSTVKTERLLQTMLYSLISPGGLNFGRAILFLLSEDGKSLVARMAMGPRDRKEARRIDRLPRELPGEESAASGKTIRELLWPEAETLRIVLSDAGCFVGRAVLEQRPIRTETGCVEHTGKKALNHDVGFCKDHPAVFAAVPLMIKGESRGVIYVDNLFRERDLTEEDIQLLTTFASNACLAMENAFLYESLEKAVDTVRSTQDRLMQSEKLMALGEMAARIAHEIKNPLTVIGGFARRIALPPPRKDGGRSVERYAQIILKEVQRLERIIQETLYFSREVVPELRNVDLNNEVREVLSMFREELQDARITAEMDLSPEIPVIFVDPDQVRQVLWNLVSNAVQAMENSGTLKVATRPSAPPQGAGVNVQVSDTGGGIPHDVVHNIFNPFFTTKAKGTGLGLPIVHAIVEKHGGTIQLDNQEGKGVTFTVSFPLLPKDAGAGDRILEQMRKSGGHGIGITSHKE
jgi:two-component system sensor histidine kinase HydH